VREEKKYSPFPPEGHVQPSKLDAALESGEYFLTEAQRAAKKAEARADAAVERAETRRAERAALFEPPQETGAKAAAGGAAAAGAAGAGAAWTDGRLSDLMGKFRKTTAPRLGRADGAGAGVEVVAGARAAEPVAADDAPRSKGKRRAREAEAEAEAAAVPSAGHKAKKARAVRTEE
jgi:hypothetical protein